MTENRFRSLCNIFAAAIKDAGPQGLPSGELYAASMGHVTLSEFQLAISILKDVGLVAERYHVLTWAPN